MEKYYGGIEAGGTKFICAIGRGPGELYESSRFPTTQPAETVEQAIAFFQAHRSKYALQAIGIASFGPLDLNPGSKTYGHITSTPKPGWRGFDLAGRLQAALGVPIALDTDVNAAALAEGWWGAAQGLDTFVYLTVGTGIGGGGLVNGKVIHGLLQQW